MIIDELLRADLDAPRKQPHPVVRIYHRLPDGYGMTDVSYSPVREYVSVCMVRRPDGKGPVRCLLRRLP